MDIWIYEVVRWAIQIMTGLAIVKLFTHFCLAPFYEVKEKLRQISVRRHSNRPYLPTLSVIVPAWNEEVGVLKTVQSLLANNYPNLEVVVVNDGSTDATSEKVSEFITTGLKEKKFESKTIKFVDNKKNGGKGKALNDGIKASTGDIILTMDADSAIEKNGLWNLVRYFADPKVMSAVGNVKVANNSTWVGMAQRLEYLFGFYFKRAHAVLGAEYIFGGACAAYRKEVFQQIGLFDEINKTEDIEMSMRSRFHGMDCAYAENVVVYTEGASTHVGLLNQRLRWKKGRIDTFQKFSQLFFSTDERHNTALSFWVLPLAIIEETNLFFAPFAVSLIVGYTLITQDYISIAFGLLLIMFFYFTNAVFSRDRSWKLILSFPFTWTIFFYFIWIEYMALVKSIYMLFRGEQVVWQKWTRVGIGSEIKTN
jgi:poly-beta-1,6-N-acetyl-D-glucosamine synthase